MVEGITMGPAFFVHTNKTVGSTSEQAKDYKKEQEQFLFALQKGEEKINKLKSNWIGKLPEEELEIYEAHIEILKDPELKNKTIQSIETEGWSASTAFNKVTEEYCEVLKSLGDPYLMERIEDIQMLSQMIIGILKGTEEEEIQLKESSIIVAEKLTTNQFASINSDLILGLILSKGGRTDHVMILAKALGIPALINIEPSIQGIQTGDRLLLDTLSAEVILQPEADILERAKIKKKNFDQKKREQIASSHQPAVTKSGRKIAIYANIGSTDEVKTAKTNGAEGIGLLRSELCFLERTAFPTENEQYETYKEILDVLPKSQHTIRLVDFGSDKPLKFLSLAQEENPAMGLRALRLGIAHYNELLKPQIRAILRLTKEYNLRILCPMIATPADFDQIYQCIEREYKQLNKEGFLLEKLPAIGIMVEIPNVAFRPELFLDAVDFFSFGTNDLAQFLMAADRTNKNVSNYISEAQDSLLLLIKEFTKKVESKKKSVSICGELASELNCIKPLIQMNINALSIAPASIPIVKAYIRSLE